MKCFFRCAFIDCACIFHEVQNVLFYHFAVGKAGAQRGFQTVPEDRVSQLDLISREARIPIEPYL